MNAVNKCLKRPMNIFSVTLHISAYGTDDPQQNTLDTLVDWTAPLSNQESVNLSLALTHLLTEICPQAFAPPSESARTIKALIEAAAQAERESAEPAANPSPEASHD